MKKFIKAVLDTIDTIVRMVVTGILISCMVLIIIPALSIFVVIGDKMSLSAAYWRLIKAFILGVEEGLSKG